MEKSAGWRNKPLFRHRLVTLGADELAFHLDQAVFRHCAEAYGAHLGASRRAPVRCGGAGRGAFHHANLLATAAWTDGTVADDGPATQATFLSRADRHAGFSHGLAGRAQAIAHDESNYAWNQ